MGAGISQLRNTKDQLRSLHSGLNGDRRLRCRSSDYGGRAGKYGGCHVTTALDYAPQRVDAERGVNRVVQGGVDCSYICYELSRFDRDRVGNLYDVFIAHLERGGEEIASGISEVKIVNYRD